MNFKIYDISSLETVSQTFVNILLNQVGDYKFSATLSDNQYWLLCDGRSLLRSEYPALFDVIGTSFGPGDNPGSTFALPDFRGRVTGAIGAGPGLTNRSLGASVGAETHTLTIPQLPSHLHTGTTDSAGTHSHPITDPGHTHSYVNQPNTANPAVSLTTTDVADNVNVNQTTGSSTTGITINATGAHVHTFTSNNTGGGLPHNNMQPTLFGFNVFICYSQTDSYY